MSPDAALAIYVACVLLVAVTAAVGAARLRVIVATLRVIRGEVLALRSALEREREHKREMREMLCAMRAWVEATHPIDPPPPDQRH